jgi:N6-adenosine-specific RNA methylase IME4
MIPFPNKKYNIIYADPPWEVKRHGPIKNSSPLAKKRQSPDYYEKRLKNPLPPLYSMMSIEEIKALPIPSISATDSVLFMWTINRYLEYSWSIATSWGFIPSCVLTWVKKPREVLFGGAFAPNVEYILYARKGKLKTQKRQNSRWFLQSRISNHSEKPAFFRDLIVETFGDIPRIELFARQATPGWDVWGNEVKVSS